MGILDRLISGEELMGGKRETRDELAYQLFEMIKSKETGNEIVTSNLNDENMIWALGRLMLHYKLVKNFYLDPDRIRQDYLLCTYLLDSTKSYNGRFMDQLTEMLRANFISYGVGDNRRNNKNNMLGEGVNYG